MNNGILVHSKSGTILTFARKIQQELLSKGHTVELTHLETNPQINSGTATKHPPFQITNLPDCRNYDVLLVGGPVWAFIASPVIVELFEDLPQLAGKKVISFVIMGFPLP